MAKYHVLHSLLTSTKGSGVIGRLKISKFSSKGTGFSKENIVRHLKALKKMHLCLSLPFLKQLNKATNHIPLCVMLDLDE